jgi:long-subunit fatty acid transport protein
MFGGIGIPDMVEVNSAISAATGASSIAMFDGNSSMIGNPAALTKLKKSVLQAGASAVLVSEEQFDEGDLRYENTQNYPNPLRTQSVIVRYQKFAVGVSRGLIGDYFFKFERLANKDDPKSDLLTTENTGGLYMLSAHFAAEAVPKLSIGGSLNMFRGSGDFESLRKGKTSSGTSSEFSEDSGVGITLGGLYQIHDKVNIAVAYRSETEIQVKTTKREIVAGKSGKPDTIRTKWRFPSSFGLGATYEHENILLIGEVHRVNWSDYTIQIGSGQTERPNFFDLTNYHIGVEYKANIPDISSDPVRLRAGFYTAPFYFVEQRSTDETKGYFLTAGIGLSFDVVRLDIAARYGKKNLTDFDENSEYEGSIADIFATLTYQTDFGFFAGKTDKTP